MEWADKIDAARYDSIEQLRSAQEPALRINAALSVDPSSELSRRLVQQLRQRSLAEVASEPEVQSRFHQFLQKSERGLERLRGTSRLVDDIVVFDVDAEDVLIDRFAPYFLHPEARASVGLTRSTKGIVLRTMRNPWRQGPHPHLGAIAVLFGGGGHERIGSILFPPEREAEARRALETFISALSTRSP